LDLISAETPPPIAAIDCENGIRGMHDIPATAERQRLIDLYEREYLVLQADRAERRRAAHRLRYQVYCLENPFEESSAYPDGMERDEFDDHSVQSLLQRRVDGAAIGTVRLILPVEGRAGDSLPFQRLCRPIVPLLDLLLPIETMAEVSRFCISKELRRRPAIQGSGAETARRIASLSRYATLGLIRSLIENSIEHGITHWCLVVEPALMRFLASLGLRFHPLGPVVEHHGLRQPCHADLAMLLDGVREQRPDVWEVITDDGRLAVPEGARTDRRQMLRHMAAHQTVRARPDSINAAGLTVAELAVA
jgi:N-acyl amino acid synthase of PEP-CTERM/exosortase system